MVGARARSEREEDSSDESAGMWDLFYIFFRFGCSVVLVKDQQMLALSTNQP